MNSINAITASVLLALANAEAPVYTQYNRYANTSCVGQPTTIFSAEGGQCLIQGTQATSCADYPGSAWFQSQKTSCASGPLDLSGFGQTKYVAKYAWSTSDECANGPGQVDAYLADGECHTFSSGQSFRASCNGDQASFKMCSDAKCTVCDETTGSGKCDIVGAGASTKMMCVSSPKNGGKVGETDTNAASTIGAGLAALIPLVAMAL